MFGGLKDKIVRALALRWFADKVEDWRKDKGMGGKVLKFLDGWKLIIGVVLLFGTKVWDAAHNGHTGDFLGSVLSTLGWLPGPQSGFTADGIALAAGSAIALWGFVMKIVKAGQQLKAGAKISETLSTEGYVKASVADVGVPATVAMATDGVTPPAMAPIPSK